MSLTRYDGLADAYDAFVDLHSPYYRAVAETLARLLGPGAGRCVDVGCGGGHFIPVATDLGWTVVGVDSSEDQLRVARRKLPQLEFVQADATALPFDDESFDASFSTFTHTDFDDFASTIHEVVRVLKRGGRFVYAGNHPCFVGATQEHGDTGLPLLHPGYRQASRWNSTDAPGATPGGWRVRLGSFVHLPLADFLSAFSGLTLVASEEPQDGFEYPKTLALAFTKP